MVRSLHPLALQLWAPASARIRPGPTARVALPLVALAGTLMAAMPAAAAELVPKDLKDFQKYIFAVSWQPGFCQTFAPSGTERKKPPPECAQKEQAQKANFLTIHGLWPSLPASLAQRMGSISQAQKADRWRSSGCAVAPLTFPEVPSSNKCSARDLNLSADLKQRLAAAMPGVTSCLDEYEFAKHGVCFKFDQTVYFGRMIELLTQLRSGPVGTFMANSYGKVVPREQLIAALNQTFGAEAARAIELLCAQSQGRSYLTELRIPILATRINQPLGPASIAPASAGKKDTCGPRILIDPVGW